MKRRSTRWRRSAEASSSGRHRGAVPASGRRAALIAIAGEAIEDEQGGTVGAVVAVSDNRRPKGSGSAADILNRELSHRLKNTLTLVHSIASQTLRNAPSLDAAR